MAQRHCYLYLVLLCTGQFSILDGTKILPNTNQQHFVNILQTGKPSLIYFKRTTNPSISLFLQQLEKSSESLEEYGITVAQVDCTTENVPKYCENNDVLKKAYLFRGNIMLRSFAIDALFDVDAIVANVLFVLLFNEIKYVSSLVDLHDIENDMKGRGDVVVTFVRAIGVPEHRAIMETAFVYGAKYQFVLTTEQSILEDLDLEDSDKLSARLWFCHCKMVVDRTQPCKRFFLEQPLTTVNIHSYLKVLEAPLVVESSVGPEEVSTVHTQLKMPVVFLFTQRETYKHDRITAESVAWQLLGKAGVVLVPRAQLQSNVPEDVTVGFRSAGGDSSISYLVVTSVEEIVDVVKSEGKHTSTSEADDEEESEDVDFRGIQDDEVAEAIYRNGWRELDVDLIPALTDRSFPQSLLATPHVVVLFYTAWDAVSMVFLQSYLEVSTRLADLKDLSLSRVNCGDWPDICSNENATQLPVVKIYSPGKDPLFYTGMLGAQNLLKFIMLSRLANPVQLTTMEDIEAYLSGELHGDLKPYRHISVVGLFSPDMEKEHDDFAKAANSLRGIVVTGCYVGNDNPYLSQRFGVVPPALVFAKHDKSHIEGVQLEKSNTKDIESAIKSSMLENFPELTVENLPSYFQPLKPLLILFIDNDDTITMKAKKELAEFNKLRSTKTYTTCWIDLRNTQVGEEILQLYLNYLPQLPALILVQLGSGNHVFAFPEGQVISRVNVLHWLKKVQVGQEQPSNLLQDKEWTPPQTAYDFLAIMDIVRPGFAKQRTPNSAKQVDAYEDEDETELTNDPHEEEDHTVSAAEPKGESLPETLPRPPVQGKKTQLKVHSEL
ncbi:thioredoxin domain-containing protein 16 [Pristis pectinata]|uniref:thioredoxin domain-containing protein 16 n=1 Tax=Pristis pectinata TaxID=685728 RepID=UPI00223E1621|nr:thioredoxin domain-containing protein 16 [Pristis pectinata]XP_051878952.1 thioredoxin domain-containing protein 16 [Pristis pectinata]XP_051878960.1 thioredoxin domain-containing protein 16 [Pristis pectinata]